MTRRLRIIGISAALALCVCGILYVGYGMMLTAHVKQTMNLQGDVTISRIKPFLDGAVIGRIDYPNGVHIDTVYLEGYPWELLQNRIRHIYVRKVDIDAERVFDKAIEWPFTHSIPMTVEEATIGFTTLGKKIAVRAEMKQAPNIPLLITFKSMSPELQLKGKAELRVANTRVEAIDIEFHDAKMMFDVVESKRSSGWLSFTYDTQWQVVGEIESGFVSIPYHTLYDTTLKLNGTAQNVEFSMRGIEQNTDRAWVMDRQENEVHIRSSDMVKTVQWNGFDVSFLRKSGSVMTTFEDEPKEKIIEVAQAKPKQTPKKDAVKPKEKEKKTSAPAIKEKTIAVADVPVLAVSPQEPAPVAIPLVLLSQLVQGSAFQGFIYDRQMAYLSRPCTNPVETGCWVAKAQGGTLGYNTEDPRALPSYFTRVTDYEVSRQLRQHLASVAIELLTVQGSAKGVQEMIVKGKTPQGAPLYIELSVVGLDNSAE